jgi:hypothetical protein
MFLFCLAVIVAGSFSLGATAGAERLPGSDHGGLPESAALTGANQVPPVATSGSGTAKVTLNPGQDEVCFRLSVSDLSSTAIAAHIHRGSAVVNGPIVVGLAAPVNGSSEGCRSVSHSLLNQLRSDPSGFYVNVHTTKFPAGEIRGQLSKG